MMEQQPAIKSYFFDKGFKDLIRVILDAWERNLDAMRDFFDKAADYFVEGWKYYYLGIGYGFAGLSTVIFGTILTAGLSLLHIIILGLFYLMLLVTFSTVLGIERLFMWAKGIFVSCPRCHIKSDLPHYICPSCKAKHTRLIPSSYGIFRRTCLCGYKLPTTYFGRRTKLKDFARCPNPNCPGTIETEENTPICLPIIGGPSVGKTCFLFAATNIIFDRVSPQIGWQPRFLNKENEHIYKRVLSDFQQGILPRKTVDLNPTAFNFFIDKNGRKVSKIMYFYDAAGEAYQSSDQLTVHRFYSYLNGIILLVDPFSIPELLNDYKELLSLNEKAIKPAPLSLEDTYDTLLINLEKNFGVKFTKKLKMPLAIVLNKIDAFDLNERIGAKAAKQAMVTAPELESFEMAMHQVIMQQMENWNQGNFLRGLERKFQNYRFFACSALGRLPGNSKRAFKPQGVSLPIAWILRQADRDLKADLKDIEIEYLK